MEIFRTINDIRNYSRQMKKNDKIVGLVPTMGYLHEGHLSLMDVAARHSNAVVVSIFVNPTQFGPNEDFECYPRDFARDCQLCETRGVNAVFAPPVEEVYPEPISTWVNEEKLSNGLCGGSRPGHFKGVTTVVSKLFNIVLPEIAVFGQKDAQQARVIRKMVKDLNFPVEIIVAPIIREPDGLAMSSRNSYLSVDERSRAIAISQSLFAARELIEQQNIRNVNELKAMIESRIRSARGVVDYIEIIDEKTFEPLESIDRKTLIAVAALFGKTRLIDNIICEPF